MKLYLVLQSADSITGEQSIIEAWQYSIELLKCNETILNVIAKEKIWCSWWCKSWGYGKMIFLRTMAINLKKSNQPLQNLQFYWRWYWSTEESKCCNSCVEQYYFLEEFLEQWCRYESILEEKVSNMLSILKVVTVLIVLLIKTTFVKIDEVLIKWQSFSTARSKYSSCNSHYMYKDHFVPWYRVYLPMYSLSIIKTTTLVYLILVMYHLWRCYKEYYIAHSWK